MRTDKSGRTSAGILLWRKREGRLEVLLAHQGGPFWANKDLGHWTIPKGEVEPGEEFEAVARREFAEETGHAALRKLNLPKRALDDRFRKLGGPEKSLAEYSSRSKRMRELLSSPQHVLPAYTPQEPFVMDLRLGEDQTLEAEWAYVRRTEPAVG